jgi:hypothetical protein
MLAFTITDHVLIKSGEGDGGLIGAVLLLIPITYLIMPAYTVFNLYALWKTTRARDYRQTRIILAGTLAICGFFLLLLWVTNQ